MAIPQDLLYSNEHEWIRVEGNVATVGITDFAQSQLGEIVFVELPRVGDTFEQGDEFGTIEAVKAVSELFIPASGKVLEVNAELENSPELVNDDAYGDGWIIRIELSNTDELKNLLSAAAYQDFTSGE